MFHSIIVSTGITSGGHPRWRGADYPAQHPKFNPQIDPRDRHGWDVGDLLTLSSLDAWDSVMLFEAWLEQALAQDRVSIRAG